MFQGRLKTTLLDSGRLADADFERAIRAGRAGRLLAQLDRVTELEQGNLIFDNFVPYTYLYCGWSSAGSPPSPMTESTGSGRSWFAFICLTDLTGEPTYTEYNGSVAYWNTIHEVPNSVDTSGGAKRFVQDQIEDWVAWSDAGGKEQIFFRNRWLYLPSQAVSSSINSLDIYWRADCQSTGTGSSKSRSGRIRFKDSGGNPVTINKSSSQVLLIEYNWSLISV